MDPIIDLINELVADPGVSTDRIRRGGPATGADPDAQPPGSWRKFVILVRLPTAQDVRAMRAPVRRMTVVARCYGASYAEASTLAREVEAAVHNRGPRIGVSLIYRSFVPADGGEERDPDTGQPLVTLTLSLHAATVAAS